MPERKRPRRAPQRTAPARPLSEEDRRARSLRQSGNQTDRRVTK